MFTAIVGRSPLMCEKCQAEYMTRDNTRRSLKKWGVVGGERNLLICRVLKTNLRNQENLNPRHRRRRRDFIWPNADLFHTSARGLCIILTDVCAGTELRRPIPKRFPEGHIHKEAKKRKHLDTNLDRLCGLLFCIKSDKEVRLHEI